MILDRGHIRWAVFSAVVLVVSAVAYVAYATTAPGGPDGGSFTGLVFGGTGTAFILFAAGLAVRKRWPHYRFGRASTWLKGHLWLGALSLPLILFHGGFAFGGALTSMLMWLFLIVFATGLVGLGIQQLLPRLMTKNVPQETVYEQIDHVRRQLFEEASQLVRGQAERGAAVARAKEGGAIRGRVVRSRTASADEQEAAAHADVRAPVVRFVEEHVRPFFRVDGARGSPLADPHRRGAMFAELRQKVDPALHDATRDLEALCEQRAQLEVQRRLHLWLHGWLFVHVPLSWGMIVLTLIHAVMALYY